MHNSNLVHLSKVFMFVVIHFGSEVLSASTLRRNQYLLNVQGKVVLDALGLKAPSEHIKR